MEKKKGLLEITYQNVVWRIVGAVRRKAQDIPVFRDSHNGCIRITIVPLSRDADEWLGGGLYDDSCLYDYECHAGAEIDCCEREFVFKIDPRGSHTIQYVCEDGHTEPVNCYGYSALKTAWASWKRKFDEAVRKGLGETFSDFQYRQHTQFFSEDNGWSMHDGSVYTTITLDGEDFVRLYVCTSGAKSSEDKECSLAGILEAQECFIHYKGVAEFNPYVNGKESPLTQRWREVSRGTNAGWHGQIEP